jgi:hypothetical protein
MPERRDQNPAVFYLRQRKDRWGQKEYYWDKSAALYPNSAAHLSITGEIP